MSRRMKLPLVLTLLAIAGCAVTPTGPSVMVLPGTGKNFDQFRFDDNECRNYAAQSIGTTPNQAAEDSGVRSAAVGTVVGAAAGAAIGGSSGAAVGAGTGLAVGSLAGTAAADRSSYDAQRRYDVSYQQCMYSKGHRIPVAARYAPAAGGGTYYPPPPPPGYRSPPPPPPY